MDPIVAFHNITICIIELFIIILMPTFYKRATRLASEEFRSKMRYERQVNIPSTAFIKIRF
jgi:hypothetical protein